MENNQFGRTLVETLGMLAVIGILSVSGMHLYGKAMNTIRANYVMEQVFVKAAEQMENKLNRGGKKKVDLTLSSTDNLSYGFLFCSKGECKPSRNDRTKEITVTVKGTFSAGLCKILKKKIKTQEYAGLKKIEADKSNLCTESCPAESTSMTFIIDSEFKYQENPCEGGGEDNSPSIEPEQPTIVEREPETPTTCHSNADCPEGKPWCKFSKVNDGRAANSVGTCHDLGDAGNNYRINGVGVITVSEEPLDWYSANAWCNALGKTLYPNEAISMTRPEVGILLTSEWKATWKAMWKGENGEDARILTGAVNDKGEKYEDRVNPILIELAKNLRGKVAKFWGYKGYRGSNSANSVVQTDIHYYNLDQGLVGAMSFGMNYTYNTNSLVQCHVICR